MDYNEKKKKNPYAVNGDSAYQRMASSQPSATAQSTAVNKAYKSPQASPVSQSVQQQHKTAQAPAAGETIKGMWMDESGGLHSYTPAASGAQATPSAVQPSADMPTYAGTYDQDLLDLYNRISTRSPFSYDATKDPLFQQYKDQYMAGGKTAMRDTMGQAAALTGGYGSSYGMQVGQQAYNQYLQQLNDVVPELYNSAYNQYQNEGDRLLQQYAMLKEQRNDEYDRYQDDLNRWYQERAYNDERADTEYERERREKEYEDERGDVEYERRKAEEAAEEERRRYDEETAEEKRRYELEYGDKRSDTEYERQQEARSYILSMIQYGYNPSDEDLAAAGMTRDEADQISALWSASNPDLAYRIGRITAEEYYAMTGQWPAGYQQPGGGSGYYGGTGGTGGTGSTGGNTGDTGGTGGSGGGTGSTGATGGGGNPYDYLSTMPTSAAKGYLESLMRNWDNMTDEEKTLLREAATRAGLI